MILGLEGLDNGPVPGHRWLRFKWSLEYEALHLWTPAAITYLEFIWSVLHMLLFSHSVIFCSLQPHGLQHSRLPCPSLSPRACSNSCPLSRWCHPTISSSVVLFTSRLQSFPASGSFPMRLFVSRSQSTGASSISISPSNEYSGLISFRIDCFDLLAVQRLSRVFSSTTVQRLLESIVGNAYCK